MKYKNSTKQIALAQILILLIGIIAISYAIGSQFSFVSAKDVSNVEFQEDEDGNTVSTTFDDPNGVKRYYKFTEDDFDDDGNLKEDDSPFITWLGSILGGAASAVLADIAKKAIEKQAKNLIKETLNVPVKTKLWNFLNNKFWGKTIGAGIGASIATTAALLIYDLVASKRNVRAATWGAPLAIIGGAFGGAGIASAIAGAGFFASMGLGAAVALVVIGVVIAFVHKNYSQEAFIFDVTVWQPQDGGKDCEQCNKLDYGCNEYQCHTFGKDCEYDEDSGACFAANPNDITPPEITPLLSALKESYDYTPYGKSSFTTPGVKIVYSGNKVEGDNTKGCIPAFSSLMIGIKTDEYATCRIDIEDKRDYEQLAFKMDRGKNVYEHYLFLPNSANPSEGAMKEAGFDVTEGMQRKFYIKCENSNGKSGDNNFVMEFCVDDGPDISAPEILGTKYGEEAFIQAGVTEVPIEIYTGEPAVCKWDTSNKEYSLMIGTFEVCSLDVGDYLNGYTYGCRGTFGGLKDNVDNKFYIKCKDKPWVDAEGYEGSETRFANTEPYELILKGTQPLVIEEINVNGQTENILIKDSATTIKATIEVKTSAGANTGKAKCRFREEGDTQYTNFYNNENFNFVYPNTHDLPLEEGTYDYEILCYDEGGNSAEGTISFEIETDKEPPTVIRAYHELTGDYLKIVTDENAECVYDVVDCSYNFDDGFKMASTDSINHFVTWNTQINFYIKCKDGFGNWPYPNNVCSIVVKPSRV